MLEELRPSYLIHTSVQVFACWFLSHALQKKKKKKHILSLALFSLQVFFIFSWMRGCDELGLSVVRAGVQAV